MPNDVGKQVHYRSGFTLVELMITLVVITVMITLAVPSFLQFRQRSVLRGAADQLVSFWANARFEAAKRDRLVKVSFRRSVDGTAMCLGAATTNDPADATACDCYTAGACDVAQFPGEQSEWRDTRWLAAAGFGGGTGVLVIDPKRGALTDPAKAAGNITVRSPNAAKAYQLRFVIDLLGRPALCQPSDAPARLPDYDDRSC